MRDTLSRLVDIIKKEADNKNLQNYYYSKGNINKNVGARWLDRVAGRLVLFILSFAAIALFTSKIMLALVSSSLVTLAYHAVEKHIREKRIEAGKEKFLKEEVLGRFASAVEDKDNNEFSELIAGLIEKSGYLKKLEIERDSSGEPMIMTGELNGERIGICCRKFSGEQRAGTELLEGFAEMCKKRGLDSGIYVTNTGFDYSTRGFLSQPGDFKLHIADAETLYKLFLKKGYLFPIEDVRQELEEKILYQNKKKENNFKKILAVRRIKAYISLGMLLALYSRYTPYSRYYLFVSITLLSLSLTAVIRWRLERYKETIEEGAKLEKVI